MTITNIAIDCNQVAGSYVGLGTNVFFQLVTNGVPDSATLVTYNGQNYFYGTNIGVSPTTITGGGTNMICGQCWKSSGSSPVYMKIHITAVF